MLVSISIKHSPLKKEILSSKLMSVIISGLKHVVVILVADSRPPPHLEVYYKSLQEELAFNKTVMLVS